MAENTLPLFKGAGKFYVYVYRDPRLRKKGVPIYVGKGTAAQDRADVHWLRGARNPLFSAVLKKIKNLAIEPKIEIVAWFDDEAAAFRFERSLIDKIGLRSNGGTLCNLLVGGDSGGWTHSPETRVKIAKARKSQKISHSVETRTKIAAAHLGKKRGPNPEHSARLTGRKLSEQHRSAISRAAMGREFSTEVREKLRQSNMGRTISEATRDRLRTSHMGKAQTPEANEKRGASLRASWANRDRDKERFRKSMAGNSRALRGEGVHTEETRKKVSAAVKASWARRKAQRAADR